MSEDNLKIEFNNDEYSKILQEWYSKPIKKEYDFSVIGVRYIPYTKYEKLEQVVCNLLQPHYWFEYLDGDSYAIYRCIICGGSVSENRSGDNPDFNKIVELRADNALTIEKFPHDSDCQLLTIWKIINE